jgi:hypothetical protein
MRSEDDIVAMFEELRTFDLFLADGYWGTNVHPTPSTDIRATLREGYFGPDQQSPRAKPTSKNPLKQVETWMRGLLYAPQPTTYSIVDVARRGKDLWDVGFGFTETGRKKVGLTFSEFARQRGDLVERLGEFLYKRLRPSFAFVIWGGDETFDLARPIVERKLSVGWRTWYGPEYVESYGREWLRGIPDRTMDLDDGGVFQAIDCSAEDLISGKNIYAPIWPYMDKASVVPFWPRRRGWPSGQPMVGEGLTEVGKYVTDMLEMTISLEGGHRVKMLPLGWKYLTDVQRTVALEHLGHALDAEMSKHPKDSILLEIDSATDVLKKILDTLVEDSKRRFDYRIVPEFAPPNRPHGARAPNEGHCTPKPRPSP